MNGLWHSLWANCLLTSSCSCAGTNQSTLQIAHSCLAGGLRFNLRSWELWGVFVLTASRGALSPGLVARKVNWWWCWWWWWSVSMETKETLQPPGCSTIRSPTQGFHFASVQPYSLCQKSEHKFRVTKKQPPNESVALIGHPRFKQKATWLKIDGKPKGFSSLMIAGFWHWTIPGVTGGLLRPGPAPAH